MESIVGKKVQQSMEADVYVVCQEDTIDERSCDVRRVASELDEFVCQVVHTVSIADSYHIMTTSTKLMPFRREENFPRDKV
jgi:hypothetical protein